jgi:hypothetical protein
VQSWNLQHDPHKLRETAITLLTITVSSTYDGIQDTSGLSVSNLQPLGMLCRVERVTERKCRSWWTRPIKMQLGTDMKVTAHIPGQYRLGVERIGRSVLSKASDIRNNQQSNNDICLKLSDDGHSPLGWASYGPPECVIISHHLPQTYQVCAVWPAHPPMCDLTQKAASKTK